MLHLRTFRKIFEMAAGGTTNTKISKELKEKGVINIRTGRPFQSSHVSRILRNPIYTGKILWNRYGCLKTIKAGKTYLYKKSRKQNGW
jgi:hypothetical protein